MRISKKIKNNTAAGPVAVSKPVVVIDTWTTTTTTYLSISKAEAALSAGKGSLSKSLKSKKKLYRKRYFINLLATTSDSN
jgi:hypothetical protein